MNSNPSAGATLKERYREAMPLLAELLHMQRLFTGEVKLLREAGEVNAMALGYIYGLTDAASDRRS